MTRNIQSNYMVPWKAFKSLPAVADRAVLVCSTLEPDPVLTSAAEEEEGMEKEEEEHGFNTLLCVQHRYF